MFLCFFCTNKMINNLIYLALKCRFLTFFGLQINLKGFWRIFWQSKQVLIPFSDPILNIHLDYCIIIEINDETVQKFRTNKYCSNIDF